MQLGDTAIVAFATHDVGEADALCMLLTKAGYSTLRRRFNGGPDDATSAADLAFAPCVIVLWSSSTAPLKRLHYAAERAHRSGALIALKLDDGVHPVEEAPTLDFKTWPHKIDRAACKALLHAVAERLGPPVRRPMSQPRPATANPTAFVRPRGAKEPGASLLNRAAATVSGLVFLSVVCAAILAVPINTGSASGDTVANALGLVEAQAAADVSDAESTALSIESASLPSDPPIFDETESRDWLRARDANDAEHAIAVLSRFRETYPNGKDAAEAARLEAEWRGLKDDAQAQLMRLGYPVETSDGPLHAKTRASIRAFQIGLGMTPDGKIDRALVFALRAAKANPAPIQDAAITQP